MCLRPLVFIIIGMLALVTIQAARGDASGPAPANQVRILEDNEDAALARIQLVKKPTPHSELYLSAFNLRDDVIGYGHLALLRESARAGADTRLLIDGLFFGLHTALMRSLLEDGVKIRIFNPPKKFPLKVLDGFAAILSSRLHGKVMIRDGLEMVTGGRNGGEDYFGRVRPGKDYAWLDRDIYLRGPIVSDARTHYLSLWDTGANVDVKSLEYVDPSEMQTQKRILDRYLKTTNTFAAKKIAFKEPLRPVGKIEMMASDEPGARDWVDLVAKAKSSVVIEAPMLYFDNRAMGAILAAKKRGVEIIGITNADNFDGKNLFESSFQSAHYSQRNKFIRAGVQLWELDTDNRIHAKSFVIDGKIAYVGSDNFVPRSTLDIEIGFLIEDEAFAKDLLANMEVTKQFSRLGFETPNGLPIVNRCLVLFMKAMLENTL